MKSLNNLCSEEKMALEIVETILQFVFCNIKHVWKAYFLQNTW